MRNGFLVAALATLAPSAAFAGFSADLSITKTDGALTSTAGGTIVYTIVAFNSGPSPAPGSSFGDLFLAPLQNCSWTCVGECVVGVPADLHLLGRGAPEGAERRTQVDRRRIER